MKPDFTLHECGINTPPPDWLFHVNNQSHINRVYYVIEEGAGYIFRGERHRFMKNHLYILPHQLGLEYFLEEGKFLHLFVDFSSSTTLNYPEVLSFPLQQYPLIGKSVEYLHLFLTEKMNGFFSNLVTSGDFYQVKERVRVMVWALFYDIMEEFPVSPLFDSVIAKSIDFIRENYQSPLSRAQLAEQVNLSESYFSKLFTQTTGLAPYQYIRNYRFDIAISLLSQGFSVSETADRCGFLSVAAFSSSFKKKFGYSPSEYNKIL